MKYNSQFIKLLSNNGIYITPQMIIQYIQDNPDKIDAIIADLEVYRKKEEHSKKKTYSKCGITHTTQDELDVVELIRKGSITQKKVL